MKTPEELDLVPVEEDDPADLESAVVYAARYRERWTYKYVIGVLLASNLALAGALTVLAMRPPLTRYIRIDKVHNAERIRLDDLRFTPETADAKAYLERWAMYQFELRRDNVRQTHPLASFFEEKSLGITQAGLEQRDQIVAKVATGEMMEDSVVLKGTEFRDWREAETPTGTIARGAVDIDLTKTFLNQAGTVDHEERWRVAVTFFLNPGQVYEQSKFNPQYERENPLGLTITSFIASRLPDERP